MAVKTGDTAPAFVLKNSNREEITLDSFAGKYLVLAFYPLAFTGGCTREMNTFQTQIDQFAKENAEVVGVSVDNWASAGQFAEKLCVTFPLLSDFPKNKAGQDYGVYDADRGFHNRVTYVISPDHKVIGTHSSPPAEPESHVEAALQMIRQHKA